MNNEIRNRLQHALAHAARNGSVLESHVAVLKSDIRALLAAGASEGQAEPIYQVRPRNGEEWTDVSEAEYHISGGAGYLQRIVYLRPSAEIAALRERIAGMEKDALRYRWLREGGQEQEDVFGSVWADSLDGAIDRARQSGEEGK